MPRESIGAPELRDRLLAPCALLGDQREVVGVNVGAFVRRLILAEEYILESVSLREVPFLIDAFGLDGLVALLQSRALRIQIDRWYIAQIGQSDLWKPGSKTRAALPDGSFAFSPAAFMPEGWFDPSKSPSEVDPFEPVRREAFDWLRDLTTIGPKSNQRLRREIGAALLDPPPKGPLGDRVFDALAGDLTGHPALAVRATSEALARRRGADVDPEDLTIHVEQTHGREFVVEANLQNTFGLNALEEHQVVQEGLLAVASLNHRFDDMATYQALSGLKPEELSILEEKLSLLANQVELDPAKQEERFDRVVELAGLPAADEASSIDVEQLLEARSSRECREFRVWLRTLDSATDEEIEGQISSVREAVSRAVRSKGGRVVRFVVTSGLGAIPGVGSVLGPMVGALDQFVIEKVVGVPGPASFLSQAYRSLFEG